MDTTQQKIVFKWHFLPNYCDNNEMVIYMIFYMPCLKNTSITKITQHQNIILKAKERKFTCH